MMKKLVALLIAAMAYGAAAVDAQTVTPLKYGDMDSWVTRHIKESRLLGGKHRTVYAIGPEQLIEGNEAYEPSGGSPWATSNVMANVMGVVKASNAVSPEERPGHGKCARLSTRMEHCKAMGMVNINVLVNGSIFLGRMFEPIRSTSSPYSKMEMGIPYTGRPTALQFDYKLINPGTGILTYSSGTSTRTEPGEDQAEVFIILQRRWEDADGNLYARRVGTGRERYSRTTPEWVDGHRIAVMYGDITSRPEYKEYMGLIAGDRCYYARNSKGRMVPVREVGWDAADAVPTHLMIMASSGCGEAYVGTEGMEFYVDNIALVH